MLNEQRWVKLIQRISGQIPPEEIFATLVEYYSQSHRYYHNFTHIENCLAEFDMSRTLAEYPDEVEYAIWLHDLFYDPKAKDNEAKSTLFACFTLLDLNCFEYICNRVETLILATRHDETPVSKDAQLLVDIDLSILGKPAEIYDIYEKNIREEYSWVPSEDYIEGRTKVLQSFLNRPQIYFTDQFEQKYGQQAKVNLDKAIASLSEPRIERI